MRNPVKKLDTSNFQNLEEQLIQKGVEPGTLSGILIGESCV